jgi:alkylhydroperoxidase/carboxymuconolactone decarboxylase family protein YurZ
MAAAAIVMAALNVAAAAQEHLQTVGLPVDATAAPARAPSAPTVLEQVRMESSVLSSIVDEFAARDLGEGPAGDGLDDRTREIATAAAFAALGDVEAARRHATKALRYGATNGELREVLYLTVIHAGAPRAVAVTRAFEELLAD